MQARCKICGQILDTKNPEEGGLNFNFATDDEGLFNAAMISKEILALINHLLTSHPEEAIKLYAGLVSQIYSTFEIAGEDDDEEVNL
jgi:hypothetical protein